MSMLKSVVVLCAVVAMSLACQGPKGDTGPAGPAGATGQQGPTGTFAGTTSSPVTFSGGVTISGGLTVNGTDLFAASMAGLAPAVFGHPYGFGSGHLTCGAPTTLDFGATLGSSSAKYGEIIYTTQGAFNLSQGGGPGFTSCANLCVGPLTFFLSSPSAQTITIQGNFDDGPSKIYLDGAQVATINGATAFNQGVNVPAGAFAISFVACSNNGFSTGFFVTNTWVSTYNLSIDIDRTFHRNGK